MQHNVANLSCRWEQRHRLVDRPIALEITFTVPDERPDELPGQPLNVGLSIDRSGSMAGPKLAAARHAAVQLVDALNEGEQVAVTAFDEHVIDVTPSRRLEDGSRGEIKTRIEALKAGGSTDLFAGFARAAELVAMGGAAGEVDSWVIVLSDGMGNHGLTDPASMRTHAGALAQKGIRTISIGIGDDYQADQLTALAEGGSGEFHHASRAGEIVEIVMGELRALRSVGARDLRIHVDPHRAGRWLLVGGDVRSQNGKVEARFDRVSTGRVVRAVAMLWPDAVDPISIDATWLDREQKPQAVDLEATTSHAPADRDVPLAGRAAHLWHAHIIARALELNERGEFAQAEAWIRSAHREFRSYVEGLPDMSELLHALRRVEDRVGHEWKTISHKEAYVMSKKAMFSKRDLREHAPSSYLSALSLDDKN